VPYVGWYTFVEPTCMIGWSSGYGYGSTGSTGWSTFDSIGGTNAAYSTPADTAKTRAAKYKRELDNMPKVGRPPAFRSSGCPLAGLVRARVQARAICGMRACVRACMRVCVRARVRAYACARV